MKPKVETLIVEKEIIVQPPETFTLNYLSDAASESADPIPGTLNWKRTLAAAGIIGIDRHHVPTNLITVLTDAGGRIITAFPGAYQSNPHL